MRCISRRASIRGVLGAGIGCSTMNPSAFAMGAVRLGILQFGTVQWVADVIQRQALDTKHDFRLQTVTLANTDAGRVALMASATDIVVSDWVFVATQRAAGTKLKFAPFSSATGGIMVPETSPVRSLGDLRGRTLGVAGGPFDKSWLIVRAAAQHTAGLDLSSAAKPVYAAPPLLRAKLQQGELDAVLTYWNFAAQLEVAGYRQVISVTDCARALGLTAPLALVGFVFREEWALQHNSEINGFLAAVTSAEAVLKQSETEWTRIRPLMAAPDDTLFQNLRRRFLGGISVVSAEEEQRAASRLFTLLLTTGGPHATGGLNELPDGVFWQVPYG